jgi:uncharacterized protein YdeI (YjbR/CyaY-like superfamily)
MLEVRSRLQWRNWLSRHHASSPGVWVLFYKKHTGVKSILYEDSVQEALCFGWVDSLVKRLDEDRFARKFSPRQPGSKWADTNRRRWLQLRKSGLLTPAGLAAAPTEHRCGPLPEIPEMPDYLARALKANPKAWNFFQALAPTYQRPFVLWVHTAKRAETREKRLSEAIRLLASGQKLGLK